MKIVRLQSENVMRLKAVDITPETNLITIGGKNGAGKSSVLNSIAMVLGGAALAPSEPIRAGEREAKIEADLGDFIVTRRFYREDVYKCNHESGYTHTAEDHCVPTFGETKSVLKIETKDGATYKSPQAMLDKLLGSLTFDPLSFLRDKDQEKTLRALVGLDTTFLDKRRETLVISRKLQKQAVSAKAAVLAAIPTHADVTEPVSVDAVSKEMLAAEELRRAAEVAGNAASMAHAAATATTQQLQACLETIEKLEKQLAAAHDAAHRAQDAREEAQQRYQETKQKEAEARALVPDVDALRKRISEIEEINRKATDNQRHQDGKAELEQLVTQLDALEADIAMVDVDKAKLLNAAEFPVPGLGLGDAGVLFNGIPFSQASSAEQLRVSVAIGLKLNPKLKVLLIRSGNLLDEDSLKAVAEQAAAADAQIWMEYVTSKAGEVSVMIEDGHRV